MLNFSVSNYVHIVKLSENKLTVHYLKTWHLEVKLPMTSQLRHVNITKKCMAMHTNSIFKFKLALYFSVFLIVVESYFLACKAEA